MQFLFLIFVLLSRWMLTMMKAKLLIKTCSRVEGNEKEDRDFHVLLDRKSQCLIQVWKDFCLISLILLALKICQMTALVLFCTIVLITWTMFHLSYCLAWLFCHSFLVGKTFFVRVSVRLQLYHKRKLLPYKNRPRFFSFISVHISRKFQGTIYPTQQVTKHSFHQHTALIQSTFRVFKHWYNNAVARHWIDHTGVFLLFSQLGVFFGQNLQSSKES